VDARPERSEGSGGAKRIYLSFQMKRISYDLGGAPAAVLYIAIQGQHHLKSSN
jgi:hypothetical protein